MREVPSQQFNHAIVYVPKQKGIPEGRFFDPTVDTLDLDVLRNDDQGTLAYVYDGERKVHYWQEIPFQKPEMNTLRTDVDVRLSRDGEVNGELKLSGIGQIPALVRQSARNPTLFKQRLGQYLSNVIAPGGQVGKVSLTEVTDLAKPIDVSIGFSGKATVRQEGREQRWRIPIRALASNVLTVKDRKYALLTGPISKFDWRIKMRLPAGARVKHTPKAIAYKH